MTGGSEGERQGVTFIITTSGGRVLREVGWFGVATL